MTAATMPDLPNHLGLPRIGDSYWYPILEALSMVTGIEWTFSGAMQRFPHLKVALSEGGIGWVPMAVDRLDCMMADAGVSLRRNWAGDETPSELLRNHFWFCMIDNPSNLNAVDMTGSDHIMVETDYPHSDSTWPDPQKLLQDRFRDLAVDDALNMTYRTAEKLYRHPIPESWLTTTRVHG